MKKFIRISISITLLVFLCLSMSYSLNTNNHKIALDDLTRLPSANAESFEVGPLCAHISMDICYTFSDGFFILGELDW